MSASSPVQAIPALPFASEQDVTEATRRENLSTFRANSSNISLYDDVFERGSTELPPLSSLSRVRRRSEVQRVRKDDLSLEIIEFPGLTERPSPIMAPFDRVDDTLEDFQSAEYPPSTSRVIQDFVDPASLSPAQKAYHNKRTWVYFCASVWCFFLQGWNDGSTGPLLPRIQKHYNVGFAIVSLLFVFSCVGYVSGALTNVWLDDRFGIGKIIVVGASFQTISYIIMSSGGPFPIMILGYCLSGFGMALQNAQGNGLISGFRDAPTKLGLLHAGYGLGAFVAPFVATQFSNMSKNWNLHYIISAVLSLSNSIVLYRVFRLRKQGEILADAGQPVRELNTVQGSVFKQIFRLPALHSLAIFAVVYVGIEVTLGGWIVTFIEEVRGAGSNGGYISSGFFGGIMVGRVCLIWLNKMVGPRRVLFIYLLLAIQLEVTIWVVPSLLENAIAVSFIGCLLGPMYPIMINHSTHILPKWLLTPSIGWIAGAGQTGSAILPFVTGVLSSKFGIASLQPFVVSMMSTLLVVWAMVPRAQTRVD